MYFFYMYEGTEKKLTPYTYLKSYLSDKEPKVPVKPNIFEPYFLIYPTFEMKELVTL